MLEWLDSVSPWWYAAGAVCMLSVIWLIYEIHRAPTLEECKQKHPPVHAHLTNKNEVCELLRDRDLQTEQLTIEIYQLSHQLDGLLAHKQYKEARLIADELEAALNRFIIVKQSETANKP